MARILFHTTLGTAEWAGCEELWFQAAQVLAARGHTVGALLPRHMHSERNRARLRDASILWVSSSSDRWRALLARATRRTNPTSACTVSPCVHQAAIWKPDVVVVSQAACWSAYRDLLGLKKIGNKYVTLSQLNTPFVWPGDKLFECVGQAFAGAEAAVFVSRGNLTLFENQTARTFPNAKVLYNPVSFSIDVPCPPPPSTGSMVLLNVARLDPAQKGQDLIVDVMALPKWRARDVRVRIAGGGNLDWMRCLLADRNVTSVDLLGHVSTLRDEWQRSTFGLFPSRYEGMPLAMVEGMALGRGMIATDVAGHGEWINHEKNGFLAAGAESAAVDAAMELAWASRSSADVFGRAARATYEEKTRLSPAVELADLVQSIIH
jgi:glycosyltransferase involved in cell wall biosynthesis